MSAVFGKDVHYKIVVKPDAVEDLVSRMEEKSELAQEIELTEETWQAAFGDNDSIETPLGVVKMGTNQIAKIFSNKREKEFGMIAPTLSNPDIVIEEKSESKDGKNERLSSYVFVKTFERNNEKIKFYASITVSKEGVEVSISSHYVEKNALLKKIKEGNILYIKETLLPNSSEMHLAEHQIDVPDLLPTQESNVSFEDKGNENFENPNTSDIHFRTSKELDEEFGNAWREQQNEDGRHSTQVAKTKSTYEKIGNTLSFMELIVCVI